MTEQEFYADLAADLRYARQQRGWTLYDVAAIADVSAVAVSRWERRKARMHAYHYAKLRAEGLVQ